VGATLDLHLSPSDGGGIRSEHILSRTSIDGDWNQHIDVDYDLDRNDNSDLFLPTLGILTSSARSSLLARDDEELPAEAASCTNGGRS
jgi:hypothetical protein